LIGEEIHHCLVRYVLAMRMKDRDAAHRFLHGGKMENGRVSVGWNKLHPTSTLERDCIAQWNLGNRGKYGDWK
jgi:hypothetical protein